jgi:hypothetical protein
VSMARFVARCASLTRVKRSLSPVVTLYIVSKWGQGQVTITSEQIRKCLLMGMNWNLAVV